MKKTLTIILNNPNLSMYSEKANINSLTVLQRGAPGRALRYPTVQAAVVTQSFSVNYKASFITYQHSMASLKEEP